MKIAKEHIVTDAMSAILQDGVLTPDEQIRLVNQFMLSLDAFKHLRTMTPVQAGKDILINIDRAIDQHKAALQTGAVDITCRQGCGQCCRIPVSATIPEAALALDFAESQGIVVDEKKLERQVSTQTVYGSSKTQQI